MNISILKKISGDINRNINVVNPLVSIILLYLFTQNEEFSSVYFVALIFLSLIRGLTNSVMGTFMVVAIYRLLGEDINTIILSSYLYILLCNIAVMILCSVGKMSKSRHWIYAAYMVAFYFEVINIIGAGSSDRVICLVVLHYTTYMIGTAIMEVSSRSIDKIEIMCRDLIPFFYFVAIIAVFEDMEYLNVVTTAFIVVAFSIVVYTGQYKKT